jgi:serine protease inhibitor
MNSFDMHSYPLKTAQAVNDWVYSNTKGKIEKIVESIPEDVKLGKIAVTFFTNTIISVDQRAVFQGAVFFSIF